LAKREKHQQKQICSPTKSDKFCDMLIFFLQGESMGCKKIIIATAVSFMLTGAGATVLKEIPASPDTNTHYLFFMHGLFPEIRGADAFHPPFNKRYETTALAKAFSEKGFSVITEIRRQGTLVEDYAKKVGDQIKKLMDSGVAPAKIAVVGHSKGGAMTLVTSSVVGNDNVSYVVLAGCALPTTKSIGNESPREDYLRFNSKYAPAAKGRMLSLFDAEDDITKSCNEYASVATNVKFEEQELNTGSRRGYGHAIFYSPDPKWFDVTVDWLRKK
jgi:hypothetical protein